MQTYSEVLMYFKSTCVFSLDFLATSLLVLILVNDLVISLLTVNFSKHGTSTLEDGSTAALLIYAK